MSNPGDAPFELDHRSILDGLRDAVVATDTRGHIVYVNDAVRRSLGWDAVDLLGGSVTVLVPDRLRAGHEAGFARYRETGEKRIVGRVVRVPALRADGSELEVELALEAFDSPDGEIVVASMRDISEFAELERQSRLGRYLAATNAVALHLGATRPAATLADAAEVVLSAIGTALGWAVGSVWEVDEADLVMRRVGTWCSGASGGERFLAATADFAFTRGSGLPGRVWASGEATWVSDVRRDPHFTRGRVALEAGLHGALAFPVLGAEDRVLGAVEFLDPAPHEPEDDLLEVLITIGRQVGQFVERARSDRRSRAQLRFLAEASRELDASLDYRTTLQRVASLAVPHLADVCMVDMVQDGRLQRVAWAAVDERTERVLANLVTSFPATPERSPAANVTVSAGPQIVEHVSEEFIQSVADTDAQAETLRSLELRSMVAVPLLARGRVIGALTLATQDRAPFHDEDLAMASELARRAGVAIDNARLYQERSETALTLQRSLLPRSVPPIPNASLQPAYLPGSGDAVGGDFFDVYRRSDGEWVIAVGDVCGKDTVAAAMTGLVRHTLRTLDHVGTPIEAVLPQLNQVVLSSDFADRFCTVCYVRWQETASGATARIASAGHPLPFLRRNDRSTSQVGQTGELVGIFDEIESPVTVLDLSPGDGLVLYTDGVIERHGEEGWFGEDRLATVIRNSSGFPEETVKAIVAAVEQFGGDAARDDIAVLAIRCDR